MSNVTPSQNVVAVTVAQAQSAPGDNIAATPPPTAAIT